jgi:Ca-activated chloride channel family protein
MVIALAAVGNAAKATYDLGIDPLVLALLVGLGVAGITGLAEWLHEKRIERVRFLAFGENGAARAWTKGAPFVAAIGAGLVAFGLVVLMLLKPAASDEKPSTEASKHLLICFDASPSMYVEDAGPKRDKKRAVWAGELVHGILSRIDTDTTRVTVFAIYTKAIPLLEDTFDVEVVEHLFDGMPFHTGFEPGETKLAEGIETALEFARKWPKDSATLVVVSDGDANTAAVRFKPDSIADTIVVGVGDPVRPTLVAGHYSKQDTASLRTIASRFGGLYHEGNRKHLPTEVLNRLTMIRPRLGERVGLREAAFAAIGLGGFALALLGPALALLGRRRTRLPIVQPSRMVA